MSTLKFISHKHTFKYDLGNIRRFTEAWGVVDKVEAYGVSFGTVLMTHVKVVDKLRYNKIKLLNNADYKYVRTKLEHAKELRSLKRLTFAHVVPKDQYE